MSPNQHGPSSIGNVYAQPAATAPAPGAVGRRGDAAGEHFDMKRGQYSAWVYVVFAFLWEAILLGVVPGFLAVWAAELAGQPNLYLAAGLVGGVGVGFGGAYLVFRDRWRCIEAFSSRFCSGLMNFSLLYVPVISLVYANVRGVQKIFGR